MTTKVNMLLRTFAYTPFGTFSRLQCGELELFTLEPLPDLNRPELGCINQGVYDVIRNPAAIEFSEWIITDVDHHAGVELRPGLSLEDTDGNILVGNKLGCHNDEWTLADAITGFDKFEHVLNGLHTFRLYVERLPYQPAVKLK